MNKIDYVQIGLAFELDKVGFDMECQYSWIPLTKDKKAWRMSRHFPYIRRYELLKEAKHNAYDEYLAPTLYEAQRWLRDSHGIHVIIDKRAYGYEWDLKKTNGDWLNDCLEDHELEDLDNKNGACCYDEYEKCLANAIHHALNYLKHED